MVRISVDDNTCRHCDKMFSCKEALDNHISSKHSEEEKRDEYLRGLGYLRWWS